MASWGIPYIHRHVHANPNLGQKKKHHESRSFSKGKPWGVPTSMLVSPVAFRPSIASFEYWSEIWPDPMISP